MHDHRALREDIQAVLGAACGEHSVEKEVDDVVHLLRLELYGLVGLFSLLNGQVLLAGLSHELKHFDLGVLEQDHSDEHAIR